MAKEEVREKDKSVLSLFIVMMLSLILVGIGYIDQGLLRTGLQALVIVLQFVIVKNILDEYYKLF
jgi:hypothetical protein